jgi:hypothetical protein
MAAQEYNRVGDFEIKELKLTSHNDFDEANLLAFYTSIRVFEDMFSPSITASISFADTSGMIRYMPIIGQEKVVLSYSSKNVDNSSTTLNMVVSKITDIYTEGSTMNFTLHLVTDDMIKNFDEKISEQFSGSATDIAKKCFDKLGSTKTLEIENSDDRYENDTAFIIPNFSPFKALAFLTKRAFSETWKSSSYVFFENTKSYQFKPIEYYTQLEPKNYFTVGDMPNTSLDPNVENKKVVNYSLDSAFNVIDNITKGMYNSKLMTIDLLTRTKKEFIHSYWDDNEKYQYMNTAPFGKPGPINDVSGKGVQYRPDALYLQPEIEIDAGKPRFNSEKIFLQRLFYQQLLENIKCTITIYGDHTLTVGDSIDLQIPAYSIIENDKTNEQYSGKYLITSIQHRIAVGTYYQDLELVKDSFNTELPKPKPVPVGDVKTMGRAR